MKKIVLFNLILFCFAQLALAQADSPFDTAAVARGLKRFESLSSDMTNINMPSHCKPLNPKDPHSVVACGATPEDYDNSVIAKVDFEPGKIDSRLNEAIPADFREDTKNKKVSCLFRFKIQNDNLEMIGACKAETKKSAHCGDDSGRTHSLGVGVSCTSEDGLSKTFDYNTELFSERQFSNGKFVRNSEGHIKQKFISENIFSFIRDNINQGKATYWKRGVGFINMADQKKGGPLSAANQQEWFHSTVNKVKENTVATYHYEEGSMDKWGAFVTMSVGLQEHASLGNRCRVSVAGESGFRAGTIKDSSYWNASGNAKLSYDVTHSSAIYLRARHEMTDRPGSSFTQESSVATGFERTKTGTFIEFGASKQNGNRTDVYDAPNALTGKNDTLIFMRVGYGFKK